MKMIQKGLFRVCFSTNYHVELLYYMEEEKGDGNLGSGGGGDGK